MVKIDGIFRASYRIAVKNAWISSFSFFVSFCSIYYFAVISYSGSTDIADASMAKGVSLALGVSSIVWHRVYKKEMKPYYNKEKEIIMSMKVDAPKVPVVRKEIVPNAVGDSNGVVDSDRFLTFGNRRVRVPESINEEKTVAIVAYFYSFGVRKQGDSIPSYRDIENAGVISNKNYCRPFFAFLEKADIISKSGGKNNSGFVLTEDGAKLMKEIGIQVDKGSKQ